MDLLLRLSPSRIRSEPMTPLKEILAQVKPWVADWLDRPMLASASAARLKEQLPALHSRRERDRETPYDSRLFPKRDDMSVCHPLDRESFRPPSRRS